MRNKPKGSAGQAAAPPANSAPEAEEVSDSPLRAVRRLRRHAEENVGQAGAKVTLGDYIRLLQLQKELEDEEPREIKVTWVEKTPKPENES